AGGQSVDVGRLDVWRVVEPDVPPAQIISHDMHDVGSGRRLRSRFECSGEASCQGGQAEQESEMGAAAHGVSFCDQRAKRKWLEMLGRLVRRWFGAEKVHSQG